MKKRTTQGGPGEREAGGKDRVRSAADQEILFSSNEIANDARNPSRKKPRSNLMKGQLFFVYNYKKYLVLSNIFFF